MKWPKLQLKKKEPSLWAAHKSAFNPGHYWFIALLVFALLIIVGALVGLQSFRKVYFEDYKSGEDASLNAAEILRIGPLKRAIERRDNLVPQTPPPSDPSI